MRGNRGSLVARSAVAANSAWPAAMIVWGPGFYGAAHRHHCVQLVVTLRGSLQVRSGAEAWRKCGAVLVRPNAIHEVDASGSSLLICFISVESALGVALIERIDADVVCVMGQQVAQWRSILGRRPTAGSVGRFLSGFLPNERRHALIHPAVRRVLIHLREARSQLDNLSLKALADIAGLSPSRFMHLFTSSVGVPVRPYVRWLRLQRAASDLIRGTSVTNAAHRAGFADGAHLTRTCRRMLGLTPSVLALQHGLRPISLDPVWRAEPAGVEFTEHPPVSARTAARNADPGPSVVRARGSACPRIRAASASGRPGERAIAIHGRRKSFG
jgi:AraC-like DNA-binding protein